MRSTARSMIKFTLGLKDEQPIPSKGSFIVMSSQDGITMQGYGIAVGRRFNVILNEAEISVILVGPIFPFHCLVLLSPRAEGSDGTCPFRYGYQAYIHTG